MSFPKYICNPVKSGYPFIRSVIIVLLFMLNGMFGNAQSKGGLILEVSGIRNDKGEILIALFNQPEGFPEDESRFFRADTIRGLSGTTAQTVFRDLEFGEYAITLMHDENVDGAMAYNWLGIPKEGYGFSTNYKPLFRAPKFEETSFRFSKYGQIVKVEMIY